LREGNSYGKGYVDMSNDLVLSDDDGDAYNKLLNDIKIWCSKHQLAIGLGEMAVGAALISGGVHSGAIEMGTQLFATEINGSNSESLIGAAAGTGIGALAGDVLGGIGVAGLGGAIGVPAALVIGGAASVFALAGYTAGDIAHNLSNPPVDISSFVSSGSLLLVGLALVIDGGRRCINDESVSAKFSEFKDGIVSLKDLTANIVARSKEELQGFIDELKKLPKDTAEGVAASVGSGMGAAGGAIAGGSIATASVTVLGSHALGGVALSLGIASVPILPVVAGVAGGAGFGYAAYKALKYWSTKDIEEE